MKLLLEGDKGQAVCEHDGLTGITFMRRDVPFSDGKGMAKDILVGVCDICKEIVAIPPQSTPAIRAAREVATEPIEANLPAAYLDTLDLACYRLNPAATTELRKRLVMYYVVSSQTDKKLRQWIHGGTYKKFKEHKLAVGGAKNRRLSMKVSPAISTAFDDLCSEVKLNRTECLKALVVRINNDIVKPEKPQKLSQLKALAAVAGA
jgi:hypothetical protein